MTGGIQWVVGSSRTKGGESLEIKYTGGSISPEEVVRFLVLTGRADPILAEIAKRKEVLRKAGEMGIRVSDEELQETADDYRRLRGLFSVQEMERFLSEAGVTEDEFETFCEESVLMERMRAALGKESRVEEHFVNNRAALDRARISVLVVADRALANEIAIQVTEEGEDFHALARRHSVDEATRYWGGHVGLVSRGMLPAELSSKVFNATAGQLLGPFERDNLFQLLLVEEVTRAELDEAVREAIKDAIFEEWSAGLVNEGFRIIR